MRAPAAGRRSGKTPAPAAFGLEEPSIAHTTSTFSFENDVFTSDIAPGFPIKVEQTLLRGGQTRQEIDPTATINRSPRLTLQPKETIPSFLLDINDPNDATGETASGLWGVTAGPTHAPATGSAPHLVTTTALRESNLLGALSNYSAGDDGKSIAELSRQTHARGDNTAQRALLRQQLQDFQAELAAVNESLRATQVNLDALNSGAHHLCLDVSALEKEKQSLLQRNDEFNKNRSEIEENTCAMRNKLDQERTIEVQQSLDQLSEKLHSQYGEELKRLQNEFSEREQRLQAMRNDFDEMKAHMMASPQKTAVQQLSDVIYNLVEGIKSEFVCWLKPLLRESIATNVISATRQRHDIFLKDRNEREDALRAYCDRQTRRFREFHDRHCAQMQCRRDTAFAELCQQWKSDQNARWLASQRRLETHRVQIELQTQRVRQAAEENLALLREQGWRSVDTLQEAYQAKEVQLEKSLERDFQNFVERAEAEKRSLISGRHLIRSSSEKACFMGNGAVDSIRALPALDELKSSLERIKSRADQIRFSAVAEVHMLKVHSTEGRAHDTVGQGVLEQSLGSGAACSLAQQLNHYDSNIRPSLMRMHSNVASMQHALNLFRSTLQSKQLQLGALHDEVVSTKRVWDEDIQRHLSSSFLFGGDHDRQHSALPFVEDLVSEAILDLRARLEAVMARQGQLKCTRQEHLEKIAAQLTEVQAQKDNNSTILHLVFELYDRLGQASGAVEARRRLIEVSETDLRKSRLQMEKEHTELTTKYKQLENFARRLRKQSKFLQTVGQGAAQHPMPSTKSGLIERKGPLFNDSTSVHLNLPPKATLSGTSENREEACSTLSADMSTPSHALEMPSS
ncbi:unnamed protein product [Phytomonas sp. EM1]|nr:unnamed protein product [Phytomonas sp. EM1]|eukprot:CCW63274.1 unnamed protein product [Phytomonas sp. isolate EM1]